MTKRVHVTCMLGRSGTTLLNEMLAYAFNFDAVPYHELSIFDELDSESEFILTKAPNDLRAVLYMLNKEYDLKVICIDRDIRDVLSSRHGKDKGNYWITANALKYHWSARERSVQHDRVLFIKYEDLE